MYRFGDGHPVSARMLTLDLGLSAGAIEKQWLVPASAAKLIKKNDSAFLLLRTLQSWRQRGGNMSTDMVRLE